MSIKIKDKSSCCGCTACFYSCPSGAIQMEEHKGFLYPEVDETKCIECGLCEKVCTFHENYARYNNYASPKYFALRCLDNEELSKSQSGGAFYLLSQYVLDLGGIIYGASFNNNFMVMHTRADDALCRDSMRGSKYVQSSLYNIFPQIKKDLIDGKFVLFSGTPCQVAGLRSFLKKADTNKLLTIDLLCHGVASPLFWKKYLEMIQIKGKGKLKDVKMRDKSFGWLSSEETYEFENATTHKNTFYMLYYGGLISRECCFHCPFANAKRIGDISIGDYHGWNEHHKQFIDNTGMSLVLINSVKGESLIKRITKRDDVFCTPTDIHGTIHIALLEPAKKNEKYDYFWNDFDKKGIKYVCKKYGDMSWRTQMNIKLYRFLKRMLKKYI